MSAFENYSTCLDRKHNNEMKETVNTQNIKYTRLEEAKRQTWKNPAIVESAAERQFDCG